MNPKDDGRFVRLPEWVIDEIRKHDPTGIVGENTWHEVQFDIGDMMTQVSVVDCCWIVGGAVESVDQINRIIKIFPPKEVE